MRNEEKLYAKILDHSVSDDIDIAKKEWSLKEKYYDERGVCSCSHNPIIEHCIIKNQFNGNTLLVGNCCVNKFIGLDTGRFFAGIKALLNDITNSANTDLIQDSIYDGVIKKEDLYRYKKKYGDNTSRIRINKKILLHYCRRNIIFEDSVRYYTYTLKPSKYKKGSFYIEIIYTMRSDYQIYDSLNILSEFGKKWWYKRTDLKLPFNNKNAIEIIENNQIKHTKNIRWEISSLTEDRIIREKL